MWNFFLGFSQWNRCPRGLTPPLNYNRDNEWRIFFAFTDTGSCTCGKDSMAMVALDSHIVVGALGIFHMVGSVQKL